ncbi:histidine ammonia-lyase [candidate division WOR-3 bacterium]|nr:histidine ammonia-lyase [candidate division WOR-3 bacterium]
MKRVIISEKNISIEDVLSVAVDKTRVSISNSAIEKIQKARKTVEKASLGNVSVYGINTGFGSLAEKKISPEQVEKLQLNLVLSHSSGTGPLLDEDAVRAMMFLRACVMAKGHSGVRPEVVILLKDILNHRAYPQVPSLGSVGASGDLAPLAHLTLGLIGRGNFIFEGKIISADKFYKKTGLKPLVLKAKEGLALLNGTQFMTAVGILAYQKAENLSFSSDVSGALTLEALDGRPEAFDQKIHALRPYPGQIKTAENIRKLIKNSKNIYRDKYSRVQDPYSLRCMPQVHGVLKGSLTAAKKTLETEINSVTDNPIVFPEQGEILSGGNFHGQPIAYTMDSLSLALTNIGAISERRTDLLLDEKRSGLTPFLASEPGVESGYMIAHLTSASLLNLVKKAAQPCSSDSMPTSAGREDHVSFGSNSALTCMEAADHVSTIIAIEFLTSSRAVDLFRKKDKLGIGTELAHNFIRKIIPFQKKDHVISKEINGLKKSPNDGSFNFIKQEI